MVLEVKGSFDVALTEGILYAKFKNAFGMSFDIVVTHLMMNNRPLWHILVKMTFVVHILVKKKK